VGEFGKNVKPLIIALGRLTIVIFFQSNFEVERKEKKKKKREGMQLGEHRQRGQE